MSCLTCGILNAEDPKQPQLSNFVQNGKNIDEIIAALEAQVPSDLTAHKNIILASKAACQTSAVKRSYEQFKKSLNNLVAVFTKEVTGRINDSERALLIDVVKQFQSVILNSFAQNKKVQDFYKAEISKREKAVKEGTLDKAELETEIAHINSMVEEKTLEFVAQLVEQTDQLNLKLLPFRLAVEQNINLEETDKFASHVIQGFIEALNSLMQNLGAKK